MCIDDGDHDFSRDVEDICEDPQKMKFGFFDQNNFFSEIGTVEDVRR